MRFALLLLSVAFMSAAAAHPALLPHDHAHGGGMLPDLGSYVVAVILLFAGGLVAYVRIRKE